MCKVFVGGVLLRMGATLCCGLLPAVEDGEAAAEFDRLVAAIQTEYAGRDAVQQAYPAIVARLLDHAQKYPQAATSGEARFLAAEVLRLGGKPRSAAAQWNHLVLNGPRELDRARARYLLGEYAFMWAKRSRKRRDEYLADAESHFRALQTSHPETEWARLAAKPLLYFDLLKGGLAPDPALSLERDGRKLSPIRLGALRGKIVLLDFWTSDSPGQKDFERTLAVDMGKVLREYPHLKGRVEIIGINLDRERRAYEDAVRAWGIPWPQMHDGRGFGSPPAAALAIPHVPHLAVIAPDGKVLYLGPDRERFFKSASASMQALNR